MPVFIKSSEGLMREMSQMRCKDETRELQDALAMNHSLLPGDQIKPEDPRRWLLIQREMPIPDPNSGYDRWSVDFVFVDQSAVLTIVECKRHDDTRSRREVVGQVFEYAANAQFYWTSDTLKQCAEESAKAQKRTLAEAIAALQPDELIDDNDSALFEQAIQNLKEGVVRLIFYLDEAPRELKSLADFLNRQMKRAEVLVVEAKQYSDGKNTIIVPQLFGFTEQARLTKETVRVVSGSPSERRKWDEESFFADAKERVSDSQLKAIRLIYDNVQQTADKVSWGTGSTKGSFNPKFTDICPRALFSVYSNGDLQLHFGHITGSSIEDEFRDAYLAAIKSSRILELNDDAAESFPIFGVTLWSDKAQSFIAIVEQVINATRSYLKGA